MKVVPFAPLETALFREIVRRALAEDLGWGDVTTDAVVPSDRRARGSIVAKSVCVVAGTDVAAETFRQLDPGVTFTCHRQDGDVAQRGDVVAEVTGFATALLTGERTALNFLQRLSGIATLTRRYVDAAGGRTTILDTRKTTPTLRVLEKYAVRAGGGVNHRMCLDDGILVKDNHILMTGGLRDAIKRMRAARHEMAIEIEARSLEDVDVALEEGIHLLMLDNMSLRDMQEAVRRTRGRAKVEISGSVTLDRVDELAAMGAEYISVGALTHSAPAADLSMDIEPL